MPIVDVTDSARVSFPHIPGKAGFCEPMGTSRTMVISVAETKVIDEFITCERTLSRCDAAGRSSKFRFRGAALWRETGTRIGWLVPQGIFPKPLGLGHSRQSLAKHFVQPAFLIPPVNSAPELADVQPW